MSLIEEKFVIARINENEEVCLQFPVTRVDYVEGAVRTVNGIEPDANGDVDIGDYVSNIEINGKTVTVTFKNGTIETFTTQDTTYSNATTSAAGLMSAADKKKLDGITANAAYKLPYATCSTAKDTVAKVATITNGVPFSLEAGATVTIKFSNGLPSEHTYSNITLNVNRTGAKNVKVIHSANADWVAPSHQNHTYFFTYDGTYWNGVGVLARTNTAGGN